MVLREVLTWWMNDTEIEFSWLCLKMLLKRDLLTDILEILFLVLALMPLPEIAVFTESPRKRKGLWVGQWHYVHKSTSQENNRTANSPWVISADEGGGVYSQPKAVLWVGVKSVTTCGGDGGSRLSLPATNKFRMYWLWRVSTEDSTDRSSFWFFYTDAQNLELPRQRGGQKPMGAVWISQHDFMELCQRRLQKRKPSPWPLGTMHLSLERYKPNYRKTGEPKPHILSFLVMPLKKSYCLKTPYFLFLKFICRLWDLVCDLELAIRGGSGSHTEHPPSAKFCELSFFLSLSSILLSTYLPTYLLIYQPPSLAC